MRARFIGDPNDAFSGGETITVWGVEFVKGEWRNVPNAKFARHSHFEFDGDRDGQPDLDPADLKARLDALGVQYHHKAGPARLAELLAHAEGEGA